MTIKIRIKAGSIKVAYEGPEEFLDSKLPKLISEVTRSYLINTVAI